jgi:signal transduction histidine kinase
LIEKIDDAMIQMEIEKLMGINRRIEIYLLGSNGMIKAHFVPDTHELALLSVDREPLDAYMAGAKLPILGDDPLRTGRRKPFSVAPISIMGETGCYLYIILGGERYDSVASMIKNSYIVRTASMGVGMSLLGAVLLGMILLGLLTKRLKSMREVVRSFEGGDLKRRIKPQSKDEVGQLAISFNQMADTIVGNMEQLKNADNLRRELIANISHDLRSPLASIQGYLETVLIKEDRLDAEERRTYLEVGLKNTRRLNALVGALFELSKLDAKQIEPNFEKFSIAELVQDVVMQFKPQAESRDIKLSAELDGPLPMVYADIALVERAISNLIDNAIRHTPEGGQVRIVPANDRQHVSVAVIDTGKGIPEDELSRVFERFYRVEKSRTPDEKGGAGLGLAIAKRIFELHGSNLSVQSALNKGTTFRFSLPTSEEMMRL